MNRSEFNAMIGAVDEGAAAVPKLEDYTVALETVRQQEATTKWQQSGGWAGLDDGGLTNANHRHGVTQSMADNGSGGLSLGNTQAGLMQSLLGQQSQAAQNAQYQRLAANQQAFAQNLSAALGMANELSIQELQWRELARRGR